MAKLKKTLPPVKLVVKQVPLQRMYYGKYSYKLILKQPPEAVESNNGIKQYILRNTSKYLKKRKVTPEYKRFLKILAQLNDAYYPTRTKGLPEEKYIIWYGVRSNQYAGNITLYFDNELQFNDYLEKFKEWVFHIEQPISTLHVEKMSNLVDYEYVVRNTLFKKTYRYKVILSALYPYDSDKTKELYHSLLDIFGLSDKEDQYNPNIIINLNYYSITVYTNDEQYLILLQLASNKKLKFQKAISPTELME